MRVRRAWKRVQTGSSREGCRIIHRKAGACQPAHAVGSGQSELAADTRPPTGADPAADPAGTLATFVLLLLPGAVFLVPPALLRLDDPAGRKRAPDLFHPLRMSVQAGNFRVQRIPVLVLRGDQLQHGDAILERDQVAVADLDQTALVHADRAGIEE